jgi:uncharacterized membrane protein YebE (DUF533 family)
VAADGRLHDHHIAHLYAQALVAIARADGEIGLEEGSRLQQKIELRSGRPANLDDLLLSEALAPEELAAALRETTGPFRHGGGMHPGELAQVIVTDAIAVVLAKGHVSEEEAQTIVQFATALGCTMEEVRKMSGHLAPWFSAGFGER